MLASKCSAHRERHLEALCDPRLTAPGSSVVSAARRPDWDWLRGLAVLLVIVFHAARPYDTMPFLVKDPQQAAAFSILVMFLDLWLMPLFFLVSGFALRLAHDSRRGGVLVKDRILRVLVPLIVGALVVVPPQRWAVARWNGAFSGSFSDFVLYHFTHDQFPLAHLWFLYYLFTLTLLLLPILMLIRWRKQSWIDRIGGVAGSRLGLLSLGVPLIAVQIVLRPIYPDLRGLVLVWHDLANFAVFGILMFYGYALASNQRFWFSVGRYWQEFLVAALVTWFALLYMFYLFIGSEGPLPYFDPVERTPLVVLTMILLGLQTWLWLVVWMGAAQRYLAFGHRFTAYMNEAGMPLYMVHYSLGTLFALWLVDYGRSPYTKFVLVLAATLISSWALYEFVIRRWWPARLAFGLRAMARR